MQILIKKNALLIDGKKIPAHAGFTQNHMNYRESLGKLLGKWIDVDLRYTFENSYNGVIPEGGGLIHIPKEYVEDVREA